MNPLLRENRQHLFGTGFPVITFSKPAGIEEVAVQLPVLTLGDESLSERAGDLRQGVLDFFKRGSLPQLARLPRRELRQEIAGQNRRQRVSGPRS